MTEKRKRGRVKGSGKGRIMKSSSLSMRPDQWQTMDELSGGKKHRSSWLRDRVDEARDKLKGNKP
jgi:hypothetical protein